MSEIQYLFDQNQNWAKRVLETDGEFFKELAEQQSPKYLWIGCADSRVPATQITDLDPGSIFVHRNIANLVHGTDLSALSVLQYSVQILKVRHIIVCGHYGCGGVKAAMTNTKFGLIDNWLRMIKDIYKGNEKELLAIEDEDARFDRLCELNVEAQVAHICHTTVVQDAWNNNQELSVHGIIYSLKNGVLKPLDIRISSQDEIPEIYQVA